MTTEIVTVGDGNLSVIRYGSGQTSCPGCGQKPQPHACMLQITGHDSSRRFGHVVMCFPCFLELADHTVAFAVVEGHHLRPGEVPEEERGTFDTKGAAVLSLVHVLARMLAMHDLMMQQANHADSAYDASCLREMNEAPIVARKALAAACRAIGAEVPT